MRLKNGKKHWHRSQVPFALLLRKQMIILPNLIVLSLALMNVSSVQRLVDKLRPRLLTSTDSTDNDPPQYWIGVAGGPGSGKTTISEAVANELNKLKNDSTIVIPMDGWHTPQKKLVAEFGDDAMKRRGAPWTFDLNLCAKQLALAKRNGYASLPIYNREISDPVDDGVALEKHHRIVLVEGLYMLMKDQHPDLYELWDERWFIRAPSREEQTERLVKRSLKTWSDAKTQLWGPGESGARKRAEYNDVQNMELIEPCQEFADEVIITK